MAGDACRGVAAFAVGTGSPWRWIEARGQESAGAGSFGGSMQEWQQRAMSPATARTMDARAGMDAIGGAGSHADSAARTKGGSAVILEIQDELQRQLLEGRGARFQ